MAPRDKGRIWRKCRIIFRRFRICVWVFILLLLGALLYTNRVGLPGLVKTPLLNKLRARGLDLQFSRLRWRWAGGIVAENVRFGPTNVPSGPQLTAKEVQLQLNWAALLKLQFQVNGLVLRHGRLAWPIPETNGFPRELTVENIQADLHLRPGDLWELDNFNAQFAGAGFQFAGAISNASVVRDWKIFQAREPTAPETWEKRLRRLADTLEGVHFVVPPQLRVDVRGDARDPKRFIVHLSLKAPDADTPWGTLQGGLLLLTMNPPTNRADIRAELNLEAESAQTRWGDATNLALKVTLLSARTDTNFVHAELDLAAEGVETKWGEAARAHFNAEWVHSITNPLPVSGRGEWEADGVQSRWGDVGQIHGIGSLSAPAGAPVLAVPAWGWWTNLAPFALYWECLARDVRSPKLAAEELFCSGEWQPPVLSLEQLSAALYGGKLNAQGEVDVGTRQVQFRSATDFDAQKVAPLLTEKAQRWLAQYSWRFPPVIQAQGSFTLPAWTNLAAADWRGEVRPTLRLQGEVRAEGGAFRGVPFSYALTHFDYSNLCWRVPDLVATRPEGRLDLLYEGSDATHDYFFRVHSTIDPQTLRPLFATNQQRAFELVAFTQPPVVDAEVWGRWEQRELTGGRGRIALTNFTVRGEPAGEFHTAVEYTNLVLTLLEPRLSRGTQQLAATSLTVDFAADKIRLTNGFSTFDPASLTRAISPKVGKHFEPYRFPQPPAARVRGIIPMHNHRDADLHFEVDGAPFEWWKFRMPRVEGRVDWVGDRLTLRNLQGDFYRGRALANMEFDFSLRQGSDFWIDFAATDADLNSLMADLLGKTNRLEGLLTGRLIVTHANSTDWRSWQGHGRADLRNGFIWEIPIFGVLSPALDLVIPGLGNSRAREGSMTYTITNGVVRSENLEIRASVMRLQYRGAVDLQGRVDARVQAELLRDTWVIGRVLSYALWPVAKVFEYKLTGTLREPKSEPVFFVPRILLLPFHPFSSTRTPLSPLDAGTTNAPPTVK